MGFDAMSQIPADPEPWKLFVRNKHLREENERLHKENARLKGLNGNGRDDTGLVPVEERDTNRGWPDPEPLIEPIEAEKPYPLDALPKIMAAAVEEYRVYGQQPTPLISSSAIAAASLACQGLADIARDPYLVGPISLNYAAVAVSGERKTSADRHFTRTIREWQAGKKEEMAAEDGKARAAIASWDAEHEGLCAKIKAASGKKAAGEKADIDAMKNRLAELEQNKPAGVIMPKLFYEDINAECGGSGFLDSGIS